MTYTDLPQITTSTPDQRLQALKDAKELMSGNDTGGSFGSLFATKSAPGASANAIDGFIRLAEYITTGHDYQDTHPAGKRRPLIKKITNVTVAAPAGAPEPTREDIEHFLHHVENGDFQDFLDEALSSLRKSVAEDEEFEAGRREDSGIDEDAKKEDEDRPNRETNADGFTL